MPKRYWTEAELAELEKARPAWEAVAQSKSERAKIADQTAGVLERMKEFRFDAAWNKVRDNIH